MTIKIDEEARTISLGVGDLVVTQHSFGLSHSQAPYLRARWGQEVHRRRSSEEGTRQNERLNELQVSYSIKVKDYTATISGRIDSVFRQGDLTVVEEVKTVTLPSPKLEQTTEDSFPAFRDQVRIYLYLLECSDKRQHIEGRVILVNLLDGSTVTIPVTYRTEDVFLLIRSLILKILGEHERQKLKMDYRRSLAHQIKFPYEIPREFQEEAGRAVLDALVARNHLLLSAPTGTGKTAAALHSILKFALAEDLFVFWASGKTSHQKIVADTLRAIVPQDSNFAVLFMTAREKICPNEIQFCHEDYCPYARDYYAKLRESHAVESLLQRRLVMADDIIEAARQNMLCPFELSLEVSLEADIIVGDYNYVFDPSSYIRRLFSPGKYRDWILVVDEAHNLYPRAREYFSPTLSAREAREALAGVVGVESRPSRACSLIDDVAKHLAKMRRKCGKQKALTEIDEEFFSKLAGRIDGVLSAYFLERFRSGSDTEPSNDPAGKFLLNVRQFSSVLELEGDFAHIYDPADGGSLKIFCLDPSRQLAEKIRGFHSVIAMSATLEPHRFFADVLGFPLDETMTASFPSPFPRENRKVVIVPTISTTFHDRAKTAPEVAGIIKGTIALRKGNYAVFFPSFAYIDIVRPHLQDFSGKLIVQQRAMQKLEFDKLMTSLEDFGACNLILAVQGGTLAEGVDYPGTSLIGAFIVGPGLPELSFENELLKAHFQEKYEAGFEYAYLFPGMMRVIQSAGRVIRSENDAGFIVLIDRRFASPKYSELIPRDWYRYSVEELIVPDPVAAIREFWS